MLPYADTSGNIYVPRRAEGLGIIGDAFVDLKTLPISEQAIWEAWLLENPVDVVEEDVTLKHLPGRHDQESHTPRLYIGGKPVSLDYFSDGGSRLIKDLSPDLKRTVVDALIRYGVTEEELTDLEGFTSRPAEGYIYDKLNSYFTDPDDPERQVLGLYDTRTRIVSVAPMMAYREDGEKVVLHEVGHHVAAENPKYANRRAAAGFVMSQLTHKGVGPIEAIDYGLREYSFTNDKEFLADTYLCLKAGNEVQKRNLNAAYEEIGYQEGMAGVLKELWALKHLPGRHDQKSHGRGKRDNPYATGAVVVDSYSKLAPITGSNVHGGKGYFILADGNLLDMKNESHLQAYVDYDASKYLGILVEDTEHAIAVYEADENFPIDEFARLHERTMAAGNIRVRETRGFVNIETEGVDNKTLRKLQRLYDNGKLGISPSQSVFWDDATAENSLRIHDMQDFLDAKSVADLKYRMQFKQVLQANELISFEKAGIVQTVSVPVVISDRQASETPWHYTDVRVEEQLVKLASLLGRWKHLPGRHDQKSHGHFSITKAEDTAIAQWKQGKQYYGYIRSRDIGKEGEYEFTGNDVVQERKRAAAEKFAEDLDNFMQRAPSYTGTVYKYTARAPVDNEYDFQYKESWTKNSEGMETFATDGGYLLVHNTYGNGSGKFVDVSDYGLGNYESEAEVISDKGTKARVVRSEGTRTVYDAYNQPITITVLHTEDVTPTD